jgi:hypothetical protein
MYNFIFSILNIFLVLSLFSNNSYSKNIKHVVYFDYRNEATVSLNLGVDSIATDYYDKELGEQDIPPLPPPDAVIPVFEILDTVKNEMKYSQNEYKKLEEGIFSKTFLIRLLGNAQEDFKLSVKGLPLGIDSLIIKDKINGNLFRWKLNQDVPKDTMMLRFYSQFAIEVFYNSLNATSVKDEKDDNGNNRNKTLITDYLNSNIQLLDNNIILNDNKIKILNIFDILGNQLIFSNDLIIKDKSKNKLVFIYIEYNNERHFIKKILQ